MLILLLAETSCSANSRFASDLRPRDDHATPQCVAELPLFVQINQSDAQGQGSLSIRAAI